MPQRVHIFANPIAGRGRGRAVAGLLQSDLIAAGFAVTVSFDRPADAVVDGTPDAVISVGGDGTLRAVVQRFFADSPDGPPVLPVSMGTANLMGRHLGHDWTRATLGRWAVDTIRRRNVVRLDAGRANSQLFLLMTGIGIDARVVHLLDRLRRGPIDFSSYVLPTALTFATYPFPAVTVTVDGRMVFENEPAIAFIGNVREYGTGLPILTRATPDDGLLDVCVLPCRDLTGLAEIVLGLSTGDHTDREGVVYLRGRNVRVESPEEIPVQIDGDAAGFTPVDIDVLPGRVPFLI